MIEVLEEDQSDNTTTYHLTSDKSSEKCNVKRKRVQPIRNTPLVSNGNICFHL